MAWTNHIRTLGLKVQLATDQHLGAALEILTCNFIRVRRDAQSPVKLREQAARGYGRLREILPKLENTPPLD